MQKIRIPKNKTNLNLWKKYGENTPLHVNVSKKIFGYGSDGGEWENEGDKWLDGEVEIVDYIEKPNYFVIYFDKYHE